HSICAEAVLTKDFPKPNPFTRFVRAFVYHQEGKLLAAPVGLDKSSSVTSLAEANAFIILPGGTRGYESGRTVQVLLIREENGSEWPWSVLSRSSKL
ncbi:molybdopterin molybdenumtransferase MoeA, partial [Bacillus spizizenii]|nr:molybdopterin molybdenumtransferase MoeA [Bacillus spizizenii]